MSVKITNSSTYQSVSNYARYVVDYENGTYNLDGELKTSDLQSISSPQPTTQPVTQAPEESSAAAEESQSPNTIVP